MWGCEDWYRYHRPTNYPEDDGVNPLRNIGTYIPCTTAWYLNELQSILTQLWVLQICICKPFAYKISRTFVDATIPQLLWQVNTICRALSRDPVRGEEVNASSAANSAPFWMFKKNNCVLPKFSTRASSCPRTYDCRSQPYVQTAFLHTSSRRIGGVEVSKCKVLVITCHDGTCGVGVQLCIFIYPSTR